MRAPVCLMLPLLFLALACGGPGPQETVRQFHIATLTQDAAALAKVQDSSGVTSPADDFRTLRDLIVFLTRQYKPTEPAQAKKLVDEACKFAPNPDYPGDGQEFLASIDLSRILVPFLGDAARHVMGKPKDVLKYSVRVDKREGRWVVVSVTLPLTALSDIGQRYDLDLTQMDTVPGHIAVEPEPVAETGTNVNGDKPAEPVDGNSDSTAN